MSQEMSPEAQVVQSESVVGRADAGDEDDAGVTEPNGALSLSRALGLTLRHNPKLKVFALEIRAAEARELQAGLGPNPEMEVEVEGVGGTGEARGFDAAETTIQLSQLIELGRKSQKRKMVAALEKELAGTDYRSQKREILSGAARAFVDVLRAQEKLDLSDELLLLSERSFETVEKRIKAGKDSPVEGNRAAIAQANMRISNRQAQRDLEYARKQLASFWGQDEPRFERAAGDLDHIEQVPALADLREQLKLNPAYTRWETEIKRDRAALDLEKAKALGDVTVAAGVRRFNETDDNDFVFGVSIPLPISDRNQGAKQEAAYNLAQSRVEREAAWVELLSEFNRTYQELVDSFSQATSLRNDVLPAAVEMFQAATRSYQEGKLDYLNMLDAQRTLFEVKNDYIDSLATYHGARTEIERLLGNQVEAGNTVESEN